MVAGNIFGGTRRIWSISIPLFQFVLYCVLTVIGDFQVKALDDYVENLAKSGIAIDINNTTPRSHEVAFGLNFPILLVAIPVGAIVQSNLDWNHSIWIQILVGSLVLPFWFAIVRWAFALREHLDNSLKAKAVRWFGLICSVISVALSMRIWWHNPSDQWVFRDFAVCWVSFGLFVLAASISGPRAAASTCNRKHG